MTSIKYPVQFIDAVRDMLLNIVWQSSAGGQFERAFGDLMIKWVHALSDSGDFAKSSIFRTLGINPAAWATRYARTATVARATHSVHIGQQTIVNYLQVGNSSYDGVVAQINENLSLTKEPNKWNGYIWPFGESSLVASHKELECKSAEHADSRRSSRGYCSSPHQYQDHER